MKNVLQKLRVIILAIFVVAATKTNAADISALDFNGSLLGKVIPDGSVVNYNNELIGNITADGFVVDEKNILIGGIVPQGIAVSYNNKILGKVNNDGSVTTSNDDLIGKVLPNGLVVDDNYNILGAVISPGLVYDDSGKIVGRISGDGYFYNLSGMKSGYVTANGFVYTTNTDGENKLTGKLISSKIVVSSTGKFLGSISPDGKIIDIRKRAIGNIHANGYAYSEDNIAIGHIVNNGYAFDYSGQYIGVISYNGEVINNGKVAGYTIPENRIVNKNNEQIGFSISTVATANTLDGKYLGRIGENGQVFKARNVIGKIGASGNVINDKGEVIGAINSSGPVFDYLGKNNAIATINGRVISLDGIDLGYIIKDSAFDNTGKEIGKVMHSNLNYSNNNEFIGISGINSALNIDGTEYITSPYGYVFDKKGSLIGSNFAVSNIYSVNGEILTHTSLDGKVEDASLADVAKLSSTGVFFDRNDKILGSVINANYATDFNGNNIGFTNAENLIINSKNEIYGKILPNNDIVKYDDINSFIGKAGENIISIGINGDYLGVAKINGIVSNNKETIGKVSSDDFVLDNTGALYGKTIPFSATVNSKCEFLGVVSDNGNVRTYGNSYVGMILTNNQVINETENIIGQAIIPNLIIGEEGEILGVQNYLGNVLNYDNENLGCQDIYGKIRNAQNEVIGISIINASVMDFDNKIIGKTNYLGRIIDNQGTDIGYMDLYGAATSSDNIELGVLLQYSVAFDDNDVYVGRVNEQGNVINDNGSVIGEIDYIGRVKLNDGKLGYALNNLYVYNNAGETIGYISKNGRIYSIMGEIIGTIHKGFVLDKKQNLIARGSRDYNVRNDSKQVIGFLNLDGSVVDNNDVIVGNIDANGNIKNEDGDIIATANDLQYYKQEIEEAEPQKVELDIINEDNNKEETQTEEIIVEDTNIEEINEPEEVQKEPEVTKADNSKSIFDQEVEDTKMNYQIVGIVTTPDGNYIGEAYSNNKVINEDGEIVGTVDINGNVVDASGNVIGIKKERKTDKDRPINRDVYNQLVSGVTVSPYDNSINCGVGGCVGPGGRYNPKRAEIIRQLQNTRRQSLSGKKIGSTFDYSSYTGWQDKWGFSNSVVSTLRVDMSNMITGDKPIPAVLARSIISLGDAPVTAIVERNVYADSGRNVIIPAGSRIIGGLNEAEDIDVSGRFNGESGGLKLEISWERIIRPDGIAFALRSDERQTADAQGRGGGVLGYVDEQLVRKYTMPLVSTMAASAIAYMMAADEDATGEVETSKQQAASDARQSFLEKMDEIIEEIMEKKQEIQPVTYVPAGTRLIIYPLQDLWLRTTKDIEQGVESTGDDEVKDVLIDDKAAQQEPNNVQGNQQQNNNQPLINDNANGGNQNQNRQGGNANAGILPPPSADGTISEYPDSGSEDEYDDMEIDLGV